MQTYAKTNTQDVQLFYIIDIAANAKANVVINHGFAEHTENNFAGSRFIIYNINNDGVSVHGGEIQLLLGYGLAHNGVRIYTGPTWHIEHIHLPRENGTNPSSTFKGWAWQVGTGVQYKDIGIDYAFGLRANQSYKKENRRVGNPNGNMYTHSILLSYRF